MKVELLGGSAIILHQAYDQVIRRSDLGTSKQEESPRVGSLGHSSARFCITQCKDFLPLQINVFNQYYFSEHREFDI